MAGSFEVMASADIATIREISNRWAEIYAAAPDSPLNNRVEIALVELTRAKGRMNDARQYYRDLVAGVATTR